MPVLGKRKEVAMRPGISPRRGDGPIPMLLPPDSAAAGAIPRWRWLLSGAARVSPSSSTLPMNETALVSETGCFCSFH